MQLTKGKIFWLVNLTFIAGVGLGSYWEIKILSIWFFIGAILFLIFGVIFWNHKIARIIFLIWAFLFFGYWRISFSQVTFDKNQIAYYERKFVAFVAVIDQEPNASQDKQKIVVSAKKILRINNKEISIPVSDRVQMTLDLIPGYLYGDELEINCQINRPQKIGEFSYDRYLARYDIYAVCSYASVKKIAENKGNLIYQTIFKIKNQLRNVINKNLNSPESDLVLGVLLGDAKGFSKNLQDVFSCTGLTHLVAVSGMNISILTVLVLSLFNFIGLGRRYSFYFSIGVLLFYILLVGAPASAIRAGLMGFLIIWAIYLGRLNKSGNALAFAASLMLFINPKILRDDLGFILSFLSMASIIYIYPIINRIMIKIKIPEARGLRDSLAITLACLVLTGPVIAYNFSLISFISVLANIMVGFAVPILMISSIISLVAGFFMPFFSKILFLPTYLTAKYIIEVASQLATYPVSCIKVSFLPIGFVIIYYIFLVLIIFIIQKFLKRNKVW